jgi:transcriptional regulator with XRE-family HTH domain
MAKGVRRRTTKRSRTKAGWAGDPLVPIVPPILKAALGELNVSVAELSRRIGDHEQTVAHLIRGRAPKRTRASRRAAIARALDVAEELLSGDALFMPHGRHHGAYGSFSAQAWMAIQRLVTRADYAVQRDFEPRGPEAESKSDADVVRTEVESLLQAMTNLTAWRRRLLLGRLEEETEESAARATAEIAVVRWWEYVLGPWLDGRAQLNYDQLRAVTWPVEAT